MSNADIKKSDVVAQFARTANDTGSPEVQVALLTTRINEAIEECVRERPSQWLWIHRRWPREKDKPTGRRAAASQAALDGAASRVDRDGSSWT